MGARSLARRLALAIPLAAALASCRPATPQDLYDQAEAAFQQRDFVETELLLKRLLETEGVDEEVAVRAHMLRAANFASGLNDLDRCREELQAALDLATVNSDEGIMAVLFLARTLLPTEGLAGYNRVIDEHLADLPPFSERALQLQFSRWQVMAEQGASPEMKAFFPTLLAQVLSTEGLVETDRRTYALDLTRTRAEIASREQDYQTYIDTFERFIALFPGSDPAMFMPFDIAAAERLLGREASAERRIEEAFRAYDERLAAAQTSDEQAAVLLMRADAHMVLGQPESAEPHFNRVFESYLDSPLRPQAMLRWAVELINQARFEEARELATRAALDYPNTDWNVIAHQMIQQIDAMAASPELFARLTGHALPGSPETAAPATAEMPAPVSPEAEVAAASPEVVAVAATEEMTAAPAPATPEATETPADVSPEAVGSPPAQP